MARHDGPIGLFRQDDLAWDLVDAARPSLDIATINRISTTMAGGDYVAVVEIVLGVVVDAAQPLPADVCARLEKSLDFYSSHPGAENLSELLAHTVRATGQDCSRR